MIGLFLLVAPDVLHRHVKSLSDSSARNLHFQAPEIDTGIFLERQSVIDDERRWI